MKRNNVFSEEEVTQTIRKRTWEITEQPLEGQEEPSKYEETIDEEEDTLDTYMKQLETRIQSEKERETEKELSAKRPHVIRDDIEEADELESYVTFLAAKGINMQELTARSAAYKAEGSPYNSDEEVYATAKAIDKRYIVGSLDKNREVYIM
jgi:hypothetical protein